MAPSQDLLNSPVQIITQIFTQIIAHTPVWVWGFFVLLVWLGSKQLRPSTLSVRRVIALPLAMTALSLFGTVSSFSEQLAALTAWALGATACAVAVLVTPLPGAVRFDAASRSFAVPGTAMPLALMLGIFATKYALGVAIALNPLLGQSLVFALPCAVLFGGFSGIFAARSARLLRLSQTGPGRPLATESRHQPVTD